MIEKLMYVVYFDTENGDQYRGAFFRKEDAEKHLATLPEYPGNKAKIKFIPCYVDLNMTYAEPLAGGGKQAPINRVVFMPQELGE